MLERREGKQPGAVDVLYLSLQVFHIDVFNKKRPPSLHMLSYGSNDDHYSKNSQFASVLLFLKSKLFCEFV